MSEENVEIIRRCFEALNRSDLETAKQFADPDCALRTRFGDVAGRPYRGPEGVEQWFADVEESWATIEQTPLRFIEVDDERTNVVVRVQATGRGSGVEIDQETAPIWSVRAGKVTRVETHARRSPRGRWAVGVAQELSLWTIRSSAARGPQLRNRTIE